ncbi:MAG: protein-tyrosine phosphatase [Flavobacteriales bacterium]|jgi:protein-tyrosine phosphatase
MGIFGRFFKKELEPIDFSKLGADIHSHLIPAIDDGSKSLEDSVVLIQGLMDLGFKKIITTPHIMKDHYPNDQDTILNGLAKLKDHLVEKGIVIEIEAASEYYFDYHFRELVAKKELLTFGDTYVLFEVPMSASARGVKEVVFELCMEGYKPILAHPERYLYLYDDLDYFKELVDRGVRLQVNLMSLEGYYGKRVKKMAEQLIDADLVSFLGTDLHNHMQLPVLKRCQQNPYVHKLIKSGKLENGKL